MRTISKKPIDCSPAELATFKQLALASGEVNKPGLEKRIRAAVCLVFQYDDNEDLIGISALKAPSPSYRNKVFTRAESPEKPADIPFELGWMFISEKNRGKGLSRVLAEEALTAAQGKKVFATIRVDNDPMWRTNTRVGFKRTGNPYRTSRRGHTHLLSLFVRRGEEPSPGNGA